MYYEDFRSRNSLLLEQFAQGVSVVRLYIDLVCKHGAKARQTSDHFLLLSAPRDKSIRLPQNTDRFRKNLWYGSILLWQGQETRRSREQALLARGGRKSNCESKCFFSMMFAFGKRCGLRPMMTASLMMCGFAPFSGKHRIIATRSGATSF